MTSLSFSLYSLSLPPFLLPARGRALEHRARCTAAHLPVEPAALCSVDEHAASDERSTTRRDAAVAPSEPGLAPAEPLTAVGLQCHAPHSLLSPWLPIKGMA